MKRAIFLLFSIFLLNFMLVAEESNKTNKIEKNVETTEFSGTDEVESEEIESDFTISVYGLSEMPVGDWSGTAKIVVGGGIRAEYAFICEKAGIAALIEGAKIFPATSSEVSNGFDSTVMAGVWARLFKVWRFSCVPSIFVGAMIHNSNGEKEGIFTDLTFRVETAFRIRASNRISFDVSPFYIRAAEENGKVLHGPGVHAGIVLHFGEKSSEKIYVD